MRTHTPAWADFVDDTAAWCRHKYLVMRTKARDGEPVLTDDGRVESVIICRPSFCKTLRGARRALKRSLAENTDPNQTFVIYDVERRLVLGDE